jgi:hypothetical protein
MTKVIDAFHYFAKAPANTLCGKVKTILTLQLMVGLRKDVTGL